MYLPVLLMSSSTTIRDFATMFANVYMRAYSSAAAERVTRSS